MNPEQSRFWQTSLLTIRERGARLLSLGAWTDCVFLVGPEQTRVAAHKVLLAMSSPVFDAMFFGPLAQCEEPILIPDVQPDAFRTLLTYLYTDNLSVNTFEETRDVIYVAEKYMMTDFVNKCFEHLLEKVTTGNVCQVLEFATMFEDNALVEKCNEILSRETSAVLEQKGFLEAHPSTLVKIFSLDKLNIQKELVLLVAVQKYIEARGLKRSKAGGEPEAKRARYDESESDESMVRESVESGETSSVVTENVESGETSNVVTENVESGETSNVVTENVESTDSGALSEEDMKTLNYAVQKIRLLTARPGELAFWLADARHCAALPTHDALSLLAHALDNSLPPPSGYSLSTDVRLLQVIERDQAEASIALELGNVKIRKRRLHSNPTIVNEVRWVVMLVPSRDTPKVLGIFVRCMLHPSQASCKADVTLKLKGVPPRHNDRICTFTHVFTRDVDDQGMQNFATWEEVCDTTLFMQRNSITVEARIVADKPVSQPYRVRRPYRRHRRWP